MPKSTDKLGLPIKPFFYTPDQIAGLLEIKEQYLMNILLFYEGRSPGIRPKDKLLAVNLAPEGETPVWRIPERALVGYLQYKRVKYYTRGW